MVCCDFGVRQLRITLCLFNIDIAVENGPFIDVFPIKISIYKGFSMAMLNYQRVMFIFEVQWSNSFKTYGLPHKWAE